MQKHKNIIVTVKDEFLKDIQCVADRLTAKGMKVDQVMPITGVISGTCASAKVQSLEELPGVLSIEDEVSVQLPCPDTSVQ